MRRSIARLHLVAACLLTACGASGGDHFLAASFDAVSKRGEQFDGKLVVVRSCIGAHEHGLSLIDCDDSLESIPLKPSNENAESSLMGFAAMAWRAQADDELPPMVSVCGRFHMAPKQKYGWVEVLSIDAAGKGQSPRCQPAGLLKSG